MGGSLLDNETRPGQSSAGQAQDAGLVRILCVAREGAYTTLHEPPTADPHGGWCGGWGLEAPGYPISVVIGRSRKSPASHSQKVVANQSLNGSDLRGRTWRRLKGLWLLFDSRQSRVEAGPCGRT